MYDKLNRREYGRHGAWRPFDDLILETDSVRETNAVAIRRFRLPLTECAALERLLDHERITRARLMPSFDNVAKTVLSVGLLRSKNGLAIYSD